MFKHIKYNIGMSVSIWFIFGRPYALLFKAERLRLFIADMRKGHMYEVKSQL